VRGFQGKRLAQLLNDPSARRMLRGVDVQDASTIVADVEAIGVGWRRAAGLNARSGDREAVAFQSDF